MGHSSADHRWGLSWLSSPLSDSSCWNQWVRWVISCPRGAEEESASKCIQILAEFISLRSCRLLVRDCFQHLEVAGSCLPGGPPGQFTKWFFFQVSKNESLLFLPLWPAGEHFSAFQRLRYNQDYFFLPYNLTESHLCPHSTEWDYTRVGVTGSRVGILPTSAG